MFSNCSYCHSTLVQESIAVSYPMCTLHWCQYTQLNNLHIRYTSADIICTASMLEMPNTSANCLHCVPSIDQLMHM